MKQLAFALVPALLCAACGNVNIQGSQYSNDNSVPDSVKTCPATQTYALAIDNRIGASSVLEKLYQDEFKTVYPKIACYLNGSAGVVYPNVTLILEVFAAGDTRAAYATGNEVHISQAWLKDHLLERGVLTHELAHVVQNDDGIRAESWLVEGVADYLRYLYTPLNPAWNLQPVTDKSISYTQGYAVTARFLLWLEKKKSGSIVRAMNEAIRNGSYRSATTFLQARTGKSLDDLWAEYLNAGLF